MAKKTNKVDKGIGFIWANDKTADNQPDFKQQMVNLDGKKVEATIWIKKTANGKPYELLPLPHSVGAVIHPIGYRRSPFPFCASCRFTSGFFFSTSNSRSNGWFGVSGNGVLVPVLGGDSELCIYGSVLVGDVGFGIVVRTGQVGGIEGGTLST